METNLFDAWYNYVIALLTHYPITMSVIIGLTLIGLIIITILEQQESEREK